MFWCSLSEQFYVYTLQTDVWFTLSKHMLGLIFFSFSPNSCLLYTLQVVFLHSPVFALHSQIRCQVSKLKNIHGIFFPCLHSLGRFTFLYLFVIIISCVTLNAHLDYICQTQTPCTYHFYSLSGLIFYSNVNFVAKVHCLLVN